MAIVKGPALSLAASGNLGPICFSRWRNLAIARDVWTGTVPNTSKQVAQQGYLIAVAQAWGQTLNAAERQTWDNRAVTISWRDRMGDPYVPTGYQLFMKWNIRRKVMGLTILKDAPMLQEWVYVEHLRIYFSVPLSRIVMRLVKKKLTTDDIGGYGAEYYKAGPYNSGGRAPIEGEWRFLIRKVPPDYYSDYDLVLGKWYWYKGRAVTKFGDVQNWFVAQLQAA